MFFIMLKVAFLTTIISPYRITFFNYLNADERIELKVFYIAAQERNRLWKTYYDEIKYPFEIFKGFHVFLKKRTIHLNYGIFPRLEQNKPDVIVIGTDILSTPISWTVLLYAKIKKIKIIRYESQHKYFVSRSKLKKGLYKIYYSFVDHFFVYSHLTKAYLISLGTNTSCITVGYNVGDTDFFFKKTKTFIKSKKFLEERLKYPEVMFLFSGRLIKSKNIIILLTLLKDIGYPDAGLFILGDGELKEKVINIAKKFKNLKVYCEGFKQKEECIKYFSISDIFVLPTLLEPASIVLSEALVSGLFTIGSKYDGSSINFIKEGENGFIIDPNDEQAFKKAIKKAYDMKKKGQIKKAKIRASMNDYTVAKYAGRLANLIKSHI